MTSAAPVYETSGGHLVSADGRTFPLTHSSLRADAKGGVARVTLEQRFDNPHDEPLRVTYSLPLPAEGVVSGFSFRIGDERIVGQVDTKANARERFEDAILEGRTAALLEQARSSLFTQELGNVPPRTQITCEVQIDQRLSWLPDGLWEWRFPTVVAPRYLGAPGRVADHASVTVDVADGELDARLSLDLVIRDRLPEGRRPESASHPLHTERAVGRTVVQLGDERGARLDRDVVVRWPVAEQKPGISLDVFERDGRAWGLLTLVPPAAEARMPSVPRDLIVLLDTSGSMSGAPLAQARRLTSALVDSLTERDQLELIEFSSSPRRWKPRPVFATVEHRKAAQAWLAKLQASGGTEMRSGIYEALSPLRAEAQRQVVLITDGLIGFEQEVVATIANRLPPGSRVHTVGVGSGVNRSLTQPAARAGRGVELVLGLDEDVERPLRRLLARTTAPLLTQVSVEGSGVRQVAPHRLPDLYAGAPALISLELDPNGGSVSLSARTAEGRLVDELPVRPGRAEGTPAVAALYARERVEDLELDLASGAASSEVDATIVRLGLDYQIATRLTSWVAVSDRPMVDPRAPRRHETMPHELAYGVSAEGVGLRSPTLAAVGGMAMPAGRGPGRLRGAFTASPVSAAKPTAAPPPVQEPAMSFDLVAPAPSDLRRKEVTLDDVLGPPLLEDGAPSHLGREEKTRGAPPAGADRLSRTKREGGPEAQADAARKAPRRLKARIVRVGRGETVLEVELSGEPVVWAPATTASVILDDGRVVSVEVLEGRSTAPGTYAAPLRLTLVLGDTLACSQVKLVSGDSELELVVR